MHVISKKAFAEAAQKYPNQRLAIMDLYRVLNKITVNNPLYPFYLKILDFCYRFLGPSLFKKLAIGLAITRLLKRLGPKNQIAKKPVSSDRMGIDMKTIFPSLDNFKYKDKWWIIDIGGNHLRMMAFIQFSQNRAYVKHIVSHAEYDKLCEQYRRKEK